MSANHRQAGFAVLERLSAAPVSEVEQAVRQVPGIAGAVVLATCNRFELYLDVAAEYALVGLWQPLAEVVGLPAAQLQRDLHVIADADLPPYLFAVTSGLESVVIGEGEISGQVNRALAHARETGLTTSALEQVFRAAATTSKGVKTHTELSSEGRSLVRFALELASSEIADWSAARIVLVGTGSYAGASLRALEDLGAHRIGVYSPSGRAHHFAERYDVRPVGAGEFAEELANADVVVSCTASDDHVLDYDLVRNTRRAPGASARQLIIDLGMPRNVDPVVAKLDNVTLLDLETLRLHAPLDELGATEMARCIVARAAAAFAQTQQESAAATSIASFRALVTDRVDAEIGRLAQRSGELDAPEAMRRLGNALLHEPTLRIKQLAREGRAQEVADALELLFGIRTGADSAAALGCPFGERVAVVGDGADARVDAADAEADHLTAEDAADATPAA